MRHRPRYVQHQGWSLLMGLPDASKTWLHVRLQVHLPSDLAAVTATVQPLVYAKVAGAGDVLPVPARVCMTMRERPGTWDGDMFLPLTAARQESGRWDAPPALFLQGQAWGWSDHPQLVSRSSRRCMSDGVGQDIRRHLARVIPSGSTITRVRDVGAPSLGGPVTSWV